MASTDSPQEVAINLNLAALHGSLTVRVQRLSHFVTTAFSATAVQVETGFGFAGTALTYKYSPPPLWTPEEAKGEYELWVLLCAFRDLADATALFLEAVQGVCAVWRLVETQSRAGSFTAADVQRETVDEAKRFQQSSIPIKLRILQEQYAIDVHPDLLDQILSINAARNCLVHRGGVVTNKDKNGEDGLEVKWVRGLILLKDDSGEREVIPPIVMEKGGQPLFRQQLTSKKFALGERITFTAREFADIAWAISAFGMRVASAVETRGRQLGVAFAEGKNEPTA